MADKIGTGECGEILIYQTENGQTNIEVKIEDKAGDMIVTVAHVYPKDRSWSRHIIF